MMVAFSQWTSRCAVDCREFETAGPLQAQLLPQAQYPLPTNVVTKECQC